MPPIQILPAVPTFGSKLAQALGTAGSNIAQGYQQKKARETFEKVYGQQANAANNQGMPNQNAAPGQPAPSGNIKPLELAEKHKLATKAYGEKAADIMINADLESQKLAEKEASQIRMKNVERQNALAQEQSKLMVGKRDALRKQRSDLNTARIAVQSGDVGAFSKDAFADLFGEAGKGLKTSHGVQLETATKNLLFHTLEDVTAKGTNLWLEKVAKSAIPELGKSNEANETLITLALGKLDIEDRKLDIEEELRNKYDQMGVTPPSDISSIANKVLKPYAEQIEEKMAYDTRVIYEKEQGERYLNNLQKVPKGTPLTLEKRDALIKKFNGDKVKAKQVAQQLGYSIPNPNVLGQGLPQE